MITVKSCSYKSEDGVLNQKVIESCGSNNAKNKTDFVGESFMRTYRLDVKKPRLLTLMFLSASAQMGAVLMMPALPEISAHFGIHTSTTQLAVTFFLLGFAFGNLFYGPLANRYGRKKAIHVGIVIATMGSIFS